MIAVEINQQKLKRIQLKLFEGGPRREYKLPENERTVSSVLMK
jgi:hypothetical protein